MHTPRLAEHLGPFPYSHMSREELISRAELEGDSLARALARALEEAQDEVEEAKEEIPGLKDELADAERDAREATRNAEDMADERDEARSRIDDALALIPPNTSHKTLLAIRDALNAK